MHALNNDGLSPISIDFVESKFYGAIRHFKKTAATINLDGMRKTKTARFGRTRAALKRQIVQHELLEMFSAEAEQRIEDEKREKDFAEHCDECGRHESLCRCDEDLDRDCDSSLSCRDEGCCDCGCLVCQCDDGHTDSDFDYDPDFYYGFTGGVTLTELLFNRKKEDTMNEEEKMKLSDALWQDHEFFFGKNDLRTMTKYFGDDHYVRIDSDYDYGFDDYGSYCFADESVDEFGGLPNHFDSSFDYRTHFLLSSIDPYWDHSVDFSDTDFMIGIHPNKARRASRFSLMPGTTTRFQQIGWEVVNGSFIRVGYTVTDEKVKHVGHRGRTASFKSVYSRAEKEIRNAREKAVAKREFRTLLDETFSVEAPKGRKTRFKSMEDKEQYEANLSAQAKREDKKPRRGSTRFDASTDGASFTTNVDYSLASRRMRICTVHVERWANVNGERTCISSGIEKMLVRR